MLELHKETAMDPDAGLQDLDPDGTISPAEIYQHYEQVARRLFGGGLENDDDADTSQNPPRALDWPLSFEGLDANITLDELPLSPNSLLPEYQLTQEWFEQVVEELRQAEEAKVMAATAVTGEDVVGIGVGAGA